MRKVKKKQVKDELDRQKQAEKKKRRLEKALATSAAIISELEKKKQKKKEEQERLDEEGAAIAEAVALHVLIGEEDSSDEIDYPRSIDVYVGQDSPAMCSIEGIGWVTNGFRSGRNEWSFSSRRDFRGPSSYLEGAAAAELIAAQAVKSLQIADEDTIVINDMMRQ